MAANDPQERKQISRLAAHTQHSRIADPVAHTAPARAAFWKRFLDQVDPDRVLDPEDRERRALHARKGHFAAMTAKSLAVRRQRAAERKAHRRGGALVGRGYGDA